MKKIITGIVVATSCLTAPAYAITFWHSNTVWAGQGQCSAVFSFDSGMEEIKNLQVSVSVINKAGKKVKSGLLEIKEFGQSSADRYSNAFLEGEELCEENLTIVVNKAAAIVDGKRTDLLKSKSISAQDFIPFKIRMAK